MDLARPSGHRARQVVAPAQAIASGEQSLQVVAPAQAIPSDEHSVHVVAPELGSPSGGNHYDRRVMAGLAALGWTVQCIELPGPWPAADPTMADRIGAALAAVARGGRVLIDGIVGCGVPAVLEDAASDLHIAVLLHLPLPDETGLEPERARELARLESRALHAAEAVIVTSRWAARRLAGYSLAPERVTVAPPGTDPAPLARGLLGAGEPPALVCVAAVTPRKDQLTLVDALAAVRDLPWTCTCVGPTDVAPAYAAAVRARIAENALTDRIRLVGPQEGSELARTYGIADLALLVSRTETYGMVVTEALGRGVPVVVSSGAAEETLGRAPDGTVPGLVVPPGDASELASALRRWLTEPQLRTNLAASARGRRASLTSWEETARIVSAALSSLGRPARTPGRTA